MLSSSSASSLGVREVPGANTRVIILFSCQLQPTSMPRGIASLLSAMGTYASKFDILSNLPLELSSAIFFYIAVREISPCLLVSRKWYQMIANSSTYWIAAAIENIGIPRHVALTCYLRYPTPLKFYVAVLMQTERVKTSEMLCHAYGMKIPAYRSKSTSHCLYSDGKSVVVLQYPDEYHKSDQKQLLLAKIYHGSKNQGAGMKCKTLTTLPFLNSSSVIWAYIAQRHLLVARSSGLWSSYDIVSGKMLFEWERSLLRNGIGVNFGCCKQCLLVVAAYWSPPLKQHDSQTSTCSVQIVQLGEDPKEILRWKVFSIKHNHDVMESQDYRRRTKEILVVPNSDCLRDKGTCHSHQIILQCDSCLLSQRLVMPGAKLSPPECITCELGICGRAQSYFDNSTGGAGINLASTIALSEDTKLLGGILDARLCVWERKGAGNTGLCFASAAQFSKQPSHTSVNIVSLGQIYAIIAHISNDCPMDYKLQVVSVLTGKVLTEHCSIGTQQSSAFCRNVDPFSKFYFESHHNSDWLNQVYPIDNNKNNSRHGEVESRIRVVHNYNGNVYVGVATISLGAVPQRKKITRKRK